MLNFYGFNEMGFLNTVNLLNENTVPTPLSQYMNPIKSQPCFKRRVIKIVQQYFK